MDGLLKRLRLVLDRRLSVSNLLEKLDRFYGPDTAMTLPRPVMPSLFPRPGISLREALRLSNLVAEALIRRLDLRKGERVMVISPDAGEAFLITASLVKAGGIAVPLSTPPRENELQALLREGGVRKALLGGGFFRENPSGTVDLPLGRNGLQAVAVNAGDAGPGELSLEEASAESSGFFIPYTLKPDSVVALAIRRVENGRPLLVMATSRAILYAARALSCFLPVGNGGRCLFLLPPDGASWLAAASLALCAGLRLEFTEVMAEGTPASREGSESEAPRMAAADPPRITRLSLGRGTGSRLSGTRLWICVDVPEGTRGDERGPLAVGLSPRGGSNLILEFSSMMDMAPLALLRLSLAGKRTVLSTPFLPLPPHRIRRGSGFPSGPSEVEAIRGPAVSPGWWNDLEASLRAWKNGWFYPREAFRDSDVDPASFPRVSRP